MVTSKSIRQNSKNRQSIKMLATGIDYFIQIFCIIFLANVSYRLFSVCYEYAWYQKHYLPENTLWIIVKRAYTYNFRTACFFIGSCFASLVWSVAKGHFPWPQVETLAGIPIYWLICLLQINHSTLDYAYWIREPHGLDYAEGLASNYFHGYLNLVLPSYMGHLGIRERIKNYENDQGVKFAINRLIILIPNTLFVNGKIESRHLETCAPLEDVTLHRAGVARLFKNDVYKIKIRNRDYRIVLEGATPLLSFFEAMNFPLSSTWQMREMQREIWIKFYKHLKMLLSKWPKTQLEAELVIYNVYTADGRHQDVGDVLIAHIMNLWDEEKIQREKQN